MQLLRVVEEVTDNKLVSGTYCDSCSASSGYRNENKKYHTPFASKEPAYSLPTFKDNFESPPSRFYYGSDKVPSEKSSNLHSKRLHKKQINMDVKRHLSSSKLSKERYDTRSEMECEDDEPLAH